jgi:Spy/CpxP family protein refolding chaperone
VNTWKVILATLVIFGAGVVTGGLLVSYAVHSNPVAGFRPNPGPAAQPNATNPWMQRARELLRRMDRELDLTPEQHQHIEKLIDGSAERTRSLWAPIAPQMNKEIQKLHRDIRDELTPDQRKKFEQMMKLRNGQQNRRFGTNQPPMLQTNSVQ